MIDVKFRVDGVNVKRDDGCGLRYGEDSYYVNREGKWSVVIDVCKWEIARVLEREGYKVSGIEELSKEIFDEV